MNRNDLRAALMFTDGLDVLVLQCHSSQDIPLLRRMIYEELGEPLSSPSRDRLNYGQFSIQIIPLTAGEDALRGYPQACRFYVAWKDDYDWFQMKLGEKWNSLYVPYEYNPCMDVSDVFRLMHRDFPKMPTGEVISRMKLDGRWMQ